MPYKILFNYVDNYQKHKWTEPELTAGHMFVWLLFNLNPLFDSILMVFGVPMYREECKSCFSWCCETKQEEKDDFTIGIQLIAE